MPEPLENTSASADPALVFLDRANYYPIEPRTGLLACLGCGLLLVDDDQAIELHVIFHQLLDPQPA